MQRSSHFMIVPRLSIAVSLLILVRFLLLPALDDRQRHMRGVGPTGGWGCDPSRMRDPTCGDPAAGPAERGNRHSARGLSPSRG